MKACSLSRLTRSVALALCFSVPAWGQQVPAAPAPVAPAAPTAPAAPAAEADEEPLYVYSASGRDPFVPLSGGAALDMGGSSADVQPGAFNPTSVELKGILRTQTGRWAVLTGTGGGDRYTVENGKVLDGKKKPVEGFVGIIKEKSLVLIGPNNQVTELRMKRDQQEDQGKSR